jgi:hypothetical protein
MEPIQAWILEVLHREGERITQKRFEALSDREKTGFAKSAVRACLSKMVKNKIIVNIRTEEFDEKGSGYGLLEWLVK